MDTTCYSGKKHTSNGKQNMVDNMWNNESRCDNTGCVFEP